MISKVIKLWKQMLNLASLKTDKGELIIENELAEGIEVFVEVEGEFKPALDGEYTLEDKVIVVLEGKVSEIKEIEKEEEVIKEEELEETIEEIVEEVLEPSKEEEYLKRIEELEALLKEKDELVKKLEDELKEKNEILDKLKESAAEPAKEQFKKSVKTGAMRFFN